MQISLAAAGRRKKNDDKLMTKPREIEKMCYALSEDGRKHGENRKHAGG